MSKALDITLALLVAAALGLGGWALARMAALQTEVALLKQELADVRSDTDGDAKRDRTDRLQWRLAGWSRDQIFEIRQSMGLPFHPWPDLSEIE